MSPVPLMRKNEDKRPWGLILLLTVAVITGLASVPLQVANLRSTNSASKADVQRAQELTEALAEQEARTARESKQFREDTRLLILAICDQIEAVASQAELEVPPCPRVSTNPTTTEPDIGP